MLFDEEQFEKEPRAYAMDLVENQGFDAKELFLCALKYMSHDEVRDMLDTNELSPRFDPDRYDE